MDPAPRLTPAETALLTHVATRNVPCPACSYNLRALASRRCPECGEPLSLRVSPLDPKLKPWLALLIPLCFTSGIASLMIVSLRFQNLQTIHLAQFLFAVAAIPAAAATLYFRRTLIRQTPLTLRVLSLIAVVWFLILVLWIYRR